MELSKTLKQARINANLSQKQLAEKMGYKTSQFVSNNERGVSQPAMSTLKKLCKILHLCPHAVAKKMMEEDIERIEKRYETLCKTF